MLPEFEIPDPPNGSWLQLDRDEHGRPRLSWKEPFAWGGFLISAVLVLGFTALLVWMLRPLMEAGPRLAFKVLGDGLPENVFLAGLMIVALLIASACSVALVLTPCWMIYAALREPKPSRLTFGESEMRHEYEGFSKLRWHVHGLPRMELGEVRISTAEDAPGMPERERLTVDHGADRIEIGKDLRPWERAWLARVIREWIGEPAPAANPTSIPDPPANSAVTAEHDQQGRLVLRWKPEHPLAFLRWMGLMNLVGGVLIWTMFELIVTFLVVAILLGRWAALGGVEYIILAVMLVWLSRFTWGGITAMRQWWGMFRGPAVQRLELTPTALHYRPGRVFDWASRSFRTDPPREVPLAELGRIIVERADRRQRLTIDHGAERIEIGPNLREPEREWLARVLRGWAGGSPTNRPDVP